MILNVCFLVTAIPSQVKFENSFLRTVRRIQKNLEICGLQLTVLPPY